MSSISVTKLVDPDVHTDFPTRWAGLLEQGLIKLRSQHQLEPIRMSYRGPNFMKLGLNIENSLCRSLKGVPITTKQLPKSSSREHILAQLQEYRKAIITCAKIFKLVPQLELNHHINGQRITGRCDILLNSGNILEIKHTAQPTGVDQLLHYAILRYLSTGFHTWYITLCNTNLGTIEMYVITDAFYDSGAAREYLTASLTCYRNHRALAVQYTALDLEDLPGIPANEVVEYPEAELEHIHSLKIIDEDELEPAQVSGAGDADCLTSFFNWLWGLFQ